MDWMWGTRDYEAENNQGEFQGFGPDLIKRKDGIGVKRYMEDC